MIPHLNEVEEFPTQIALWLLDHQMNMQVSEDVGLYFARIPLRGSGTIVCANALQINWQDLLIRVSNIDVTADHANIYLVNDPKHTKAQPQVNAPPNWLKHIRISTKQ